ncbi:MAG: hypothetical protein IKB47_00930 [Clostridia bacterium]|nr:hypothetical protein [Clostridia bacterium]
MFGNNFKKNSKRLVDICEHFIDEYELQATRKIPSCKNDMLAEIKARVEADKKDVATWKDYDTDYIEIAHSLLAHASFDLLASGRYHIYYGVLNPMRCSSCLMAVYNGSMMWAVNKGLIDENTRKEQYSYLIKCIGEVG